MTQSRGIALRFRHVIWVICLCPIVLLILLAFVHSISLEDARDAVAGCPEFYEKEADGAHFYFDSGFIPGMIIFNYRYCNPRTFPDPLQAEDERQKLLYQIKRYLA